VFVVSYHFTFAYHVTGVEGVFVGDIKFVYRVVAVADEVFVPDYALCAGAIKHLAHNGIGPAKVASVCAVAIHDWQLLF